MCMARKKTVKNKYYKKDFKITASQQVMLKAFCRKNEVTEKKFFRTILNDYLHKNAVHININKHEVDENQLNLLDLIAVTEAEQLYEKQQQQELF